MKKSINYAPTEDAINIHSNKMYLFKDMGGIRVITKSSWIFGAKHVSRFMLEFWIYTKSQYYKNFLNKSFKIIFYCTSDWRSAFATLVAKNISLLKYI